MRCRQRGQALAAAWQPQHPDTVVTLPQMRPSQGPSSHPEGVHVLAVGGLLPLKTARQLRADLSRTLASAASSHLSPPPPHPPPKGAYLLVVCDDERGAPGLLLSLLQLPAKHLLQLFQDRRVGQGGHVTTEPGLATTKLERLPSEPPPLCLASPPRWPAAGA